MEKHNDKRQKAEDRLWEGSESNPKNRPTRPEKKVFDCDSLCIRYIKKECITEREDELCDQPDMYREVGDVADALNDAALFKEGVDPA